MPSYKTIIFDLSEVLIDFVSYLGNDLSKRLNQPLDIIFQSFENKYLVNFYRGRITEDEYLHAIMNDLPSGISVSEMKQIIRRNLDYRIPGMQPILEGLKGSCELALLSDHSIEWVDYILAKHPFLETFDEKFFSFDLESSKKEPETFKKVLELLGRQPEECLFIDDQQANCEVARSLGIDAVRFVSAEELIKELASRAVLKVL